MSDTKSVWKKYAAAALAVVSVVGFASCGSSNGAGSDDSATSELEQVKKNGEIVFGTEGTYAPFSYHDTDDNLTGYDVEIATAVAEELGVKAKFVEANWDSLLAGVDAKKFDTVADQVTPNDERKQKYDFTDLYTYSQGVAVTKKGNDDIRTVLHLHPALAPYKCAVLPLSKKLGDKAMEIRKELSKYFMVDYDDTGSIGKRYRREDEIGTPYCITVDFDTVGDEAKGIAADNCVTVRDRDTMEQVRMPISELKAYIESKIEF